MQMVIKIGNIGFVKKKEAYHYTRSVPQIQSCVKSTING